MIEIAQKNLKKSISEDKRISIAVMSSFAILTIQYLILTCFNLAGTSIGDKIQMLSKIIVGFFYIIALPTVLKRNKFMGVYFMSSMIFYLLMIEEFEDDVKNLH